MTQRSNFSHTTSISPGRNSKNILKQNHNQSLNSNIDSRLKASISTRQHSQSGDHLYTLRLESKILEMQKKIDQQKFQIDTLTQQTENYMKICEEQKKELSNVNIEILKQEYEQQISDLIGEKEKLSDLIQNLTEEYQIAQMEQQKELALMKSRNGELAMRIQQAMDRKESLLRQISAADKLHSQNEDIILDQEERIDSLRNIERKLFIALREVESLEKK